MGVGSAPVGIRLVAGLAVLGAAALASSVAFALDVPQRQVTIEPRIVPISRSVLSEVGVGLEVGATTGNTSAGSIGTSFAPPVSGTLGDNPSIFRVDVRTNVASFPMMMPPATIVAGVKIGISDKSTSTFSKDIAPGVATSLTSEQRVAATPYAGLQINVTPNVLPSGNIGLQITPFAGAEFQRDRLTMTVNDGVMNTFQATQNRVAATGGVEVAATFQRLANGALPVIGVLFQARHFNGTDVSGRTLSGFPFTGARNGTTELLVLVTPRIVFPVQ